MMALTEEEKNMSAESLEEKISLLQELLKEKSKTESHDLLDGLGYLFRSGMALRSYQAEEIFGTKHLEKDCPELVKKTPRYLYVGTGLLRDQITEVEYQPALLNVGAADIRKMILNGEDLAANKINALPSGPMGLPQYAHALKSGILKHDIRGYYVDPKYNIEELLQDDLS